MEYKIASSDLQNDLLVETLRELAVCYAELQSEVYVVGAAARDLAIRLLDDTEIVPRRTLDLDVAVLLRDWEQYEKLTNILLQHNFVKAKEKQRFIYLGFNGLNRYEVDIVPFGAIALDEKIAWPPDGSPIMSVRCFDDVMSVADIVEVDNCFSFRLASLSGQFLIKLDTWMDRHLMTKKDAFDIVYILQNVYVLYAKSRQSLPDEIDLDVDRFDIVVAGAEWIASDLKEMLNEKNRHYYSAMLKSEYEKEEYSALLNDMLDVSVDKKYALLRCALNRISQILAI